MGLFKTREERRIERDLEVRRGLASIKKNVKRLEKHEADYVAKARRARALGDEDQFAFLRGTIQRTATQRRLLERQLLNLETALQMKDQAEGHAQFARSMEALSISIGKAFGSTDLARTQGRFEVAIERARSIEARMDLFLESASELLSDSDADPELVSDAEIDALLSIDLDAPGRDREIA